MSDKTVRSIVCDTCAAELIVDSSYPSHYVLQLKSVDLGINTSGSVYAIMLHPQIKEALHFCDLGCLRDSPLLKNS